MSGYRFSESRARCRCASGLSKNVVPRSTMIVWPRTPSIRPEHSAKIASATLLRDELALHVEALGELLEVTAEGGAQRLVRTRRERTTLMRMSSSNRR